MRDQDGFIRLTRKPDPESKRPYIKCYDGTHQVTSDAIGEAPILSGPRPPKALKANRGPNEYRFKVDDAAYHIEYKPKTWQHKAWSVLSCGMDFGRKSAFSKCSGGNKKLRHILRAGFALKVRSADPQTRQYILEQMPSNRNGFGMYSVADNPAEFAKIMNTWHRMIYDNIPCYKEMARKADIDLFIIIGKVFIIYDDMTFDGFMGDPRIVIDELNLKFDKKGRIEL